MVFQSKYRVESVLAHWLAIVYNGLDKKAVSTLGNVAGVSPSTLHTRVLGTSDKKVKKHPKKELNKNGTNSTI